MTTDIEKIKKLISNKYILLDNNVITRASDHPDAFLPFLQLLIDANCKPIIIPLIKFEYLRGANSIKHRTKRLALLELLNPDTIPSIYGDQKVDLAIDIANVYSGRKLESPNVVDCSLAAHLIHFQSTLLLATLNHKDFPTFLFDRVGVFTVDTEKDVMPIGIYKSNSEKTVEVGIFT